MRRMQWPALVCYGFVLPALLAAGAKKHKGASFAANSTWTGTYAADGRHAHGKSRPATREIGENDGHAFKALFRFGAGKALRAVRLEGIVGDDGELTMHPVSVVTGPLGNHWKDDVYHGDVDGETLSFHIAGNGADRNSVGPDVDLTLAKPKK